MLICAETEVYYTEAGIFCWVGATGIGGSVWMRVWKGDRGLVIDEMAGLMV